MATKSVVITSYRDAMREGIVLPDAGLASGEVINLAGEELLIQTTLSDISGVSVWYGVKTNCTVIHQRQTESVDANYNVIIVWSNIGTYKAFGQVINAYMRQEDPGLLPTTKETYILHVDDIRLMDRFVVNGENLQVDDIDDLFLPGLKRIQCSADTRT